MKHFSLIFLFKIPDDVKVLFSDEQEAIVSCQLTWSNLEDANRGSSLSGLPEFLMEDDAFADIEEALKEWEMWKTENALAGSAFSATDEALVALNDALINELKTLNSTQEDTVIDGRERACNIVRAASRFVGYLNTNEFDSEASQTESLLADCYSLVIELGEIDSNRKEVSFVCENSKVIISYS